MNAKKNTRGTKAEFLGYELDTISMQARLPDDKLRRAQQLLQQFKLKKSCSRKELESLTGFLLFAAKVVVPGRSFLRRLYDALDKNNNFIHISQPIRDDLTWWHEFLPSWNGISLLRRVANRKSLYLWTDASGTIGRGGYYLDYITQAPQLDRVFCERTSSRQAKRDIQYKEMKAVLIALDKWLPIFAGLHLHIHNDNQAVCEGLKKLSIKGQAMEPLRKIAILLAQHDVLITVIWIDSKSNSLADMLSRLQYDRIADIYPQLQGLEARRRL